ncbi:MAG TPA: hypothetical protein VH085_07465 [Nocardioides sp.]|jgi:hypothetical protein|nr:hypothetical protein [Nocardioides sp.]
MEKLFATVLTAIVMSLIGLVSPASVPQAWAGSASRVSAVRHAPGHHDAGKPRPGPRHPKKTASPDVRRPRPEIRHRVRF